MNFVLFTCAIAVLVLVVALIVAVVVVLAPTLAEVADDLAEAYESWAWERRKRREKIQSHADSITRYVCMECQTGPMTRNEYSAHLQSRHDTWIQTLKALHQ